MHAIPPETPHRRLKDARELSALAHPVRMGIIELLSVSGPLTATELADRLDETPGELLLAPAQARRARLRRGGRRRHGPAAAVAVPGIGLHLGRPGRRRRSERRAAEALERGARCDARARPARTRRAGASPRSREEWRTPHAGSEYATWLTADELQEMNDEIGAVLRPPPRPARATRRCGRPGRGCASSWRGACRCTCPAWSRLPRRPTDEGGVHDSRLPPAVRRPDRQHGRRLDHAAGPQHVGEDPDRLQRDGRADVLLHGDPGAVRPADRRLARPGPPQAVPRLGQRRLRGHGAAARAGA